MQTEPRFFTSQQLTAYL